MTGRQWFGIGDIDRGTDPLLLKRFDKRIGYDHRTSGRINKQCTTFHPRKLSAADQAACCVGEGNDQNYDIGLW